MFNLNSRVCNVPSIIVTHDLRDVACIGDRACLLENGRVALALACRAEDVMEWGKGTFSEDGERKTT